MFETWSSKKPPVLGILQEVIAIGSENPARKENVGRQELLKKIIRGELEPAK